MSPPTVWLGAAPAMMMMIAALAGCGGRVFIDLDAGGGGGGGGAGGSMSSSSSSSSSAGAGGDCDDGRPLCEAYCDTFTAIGCGDDGCVPFCLAQHMSAAGPCTESLFGLLSCTVQHGSDDCFSNFPSVCWDSQPGNAYGKCLEQNPSCNGWGCTLGADCECATSCSVAFAAECHAVGDTFQCTCSRDGEVIGQCNEPTGCENVLSGCCAEVLVPPCSD